VAVVLLVLGAIVYLVGGWLRADADQGQRTQLDIRDGRIFLRPTWLYAVALLAILFAALALSEGRIVPLSWGYVEPEVGFEPTTFRLRDGCSASIWSAPDGSSLLTLGDSSVQMALDGSRRIVWMIIWMIKAHPDLLSDAPRPSSSTVHACGFLGRATPEVKHMGAESTHSLRRSAVDQAATTSLVVAVLAAGCAGPVGVKQLF
jgi:hypothetical protein